MLNVQKTEEGACYFSGGTKLYVVGEMLHYASKTFWGCEKIDEVKALSDIGFDELGTHVKLLHMLQSMDSPLLDAIRIMICFENYFKAMLLLDDYVIHRMDRNICENYFPQFLDKKNQLLQNSSPVSIHDVKHAENHGDHFFAPLRTLHSQTIQLSTLLKKQEYRNVYSKGDMVDKKLFQILGTLNRTRNSLHFLNVEYIALGFLSADDFLFLRDYVSTHIDAFRENFYIENEKAISYGEKDIRWMPDDEY